MKFKTSPFPEKGTRRKRTKFLWFPKSINGEIRWLETATWLEEFHILWCGSHPVWIGDEWVDN